MNALRRYLYRGTLSCAMCFIIASMLYNRTNHVNVKYHKSPVWNCHSEDKHSISIGILIPSTTKYINIYCISSHLLFVIAFVFRVDSTLICLYKSSFYFKQNFVIGFSLFSNISSSWS